jgi:hypothetical protein
MYCVGICLNNAEPDLFVSSVLVRLVAALATNPQTENDGGTDD